MVPLESDPSPRAAALAGSACFSLQDSIGSCANHWKGVCGFGTNEDGADRQAEAPPTPPVAMRADSRATRISLVQVRPVSRSAGRS